MTDRNRSFRLLTQLSKSDHGAVFRAELDGAPVIAKCVNAAADERTRCKIEYMHCAAIASEHVVKAVDYFDWNDLTVAAYEDIGGRSLFDALQSGQRAFSLAEIVGLGCKVARGLEAIHAQGLVHRDLCPANVVLNDASGRVQIIDLGIARTATWSQGAVPAADHAAGTPGYMAPEQTGRTRHEVGVRSDLFALGVLLYELVGGSNPFRGRDLAETMHRTLAFEPPSLTTLRPECSAVLAAIVGKMMAKSPEARYATARGARLDLERLRDDLAAGVPEPSWDIARQDVSDVFRVSQRLYGRSAEIDRLASALGRVLAGESQYCEIFGVSGIGKSALIREIRGRIVEVGALFLAGKFELNKSRVPLRGPADLVDNLVKHILRRSDADQRRWRERIGELLGGAKDVLLPVIPSLRFLLQAGDAGTGEVRALAFSSREIVDKIIAVLNDYAKTDAPLVLFLDDIQWADTSSLEFLANLTPEKLDGRVFVALSYRSNEVSPSHPAAIATMTLRGRFQGAARIDLGPLAPEDVAELLADTLHSPVSASDRLVETVARKTEGNPFYINTLLIRAHEDGVIAFDPEAACWSVRFDAFDRLAASRNVVDLLIERMGQLSPSARDIIATAACIGAKIDWSLLVAVGGLDQAVMAAQLFELRRLGFLNVLAGDDQLELVVGGASAANGQLAGIVLGFAHDKIQQAAYELSGAAANRGCHLRIALELERRVLASQGKDAVFEAAEQFRQCDPAAFDRGVSGQAVRTVCAAADRATGAGTFREAADYFTFAIGLASRHAGLWHGDELAEVQVKLAATLSSTGDHEGARRVSEEVLRSATTPMVKARAHYNVAVVCEHENDPEAVIDACLRGLALLGFRISKRVAKVRMLLDIAIFRATHLKRAISHMDGGHGKDSARWDLIFDLSIKSMSSAFFVNQNYFTVLILKLFRRAIAEGVRIRHGTMASALGLVAMGLRSKDLGLRCSELSRELTLRHGPDALFPVSFITSHFFNPFMDNTYAQCTELSREGYNVAAQWGRPSDMGVNAFLLLLNGVGGGYSLKELDEIQGSYRHFFTEASPGNYSWPVFMAVAQAIRNLHTGSGVGASFDGEDVQEQEIVRRSQRSAGDTSIYRTMKAWVTFAHGDYRATVGYAWRNFPQLALPGCFSASINLLCFTLAVLRGGAELPMLLRVDLVKRLLVGATLAELGWWSKPKFVGAGLKEFLTAESLARRGRVAAALYAYATAHRRLQDARNYFWLGELQTSLGEFYLRLNLQQEAALYLGAAAETWNAYGCRHKIEAAALHAELVRKYRRVAERSALRTLGSGTTEPNARSVDMLSIIKASQAIATAATEDDLMRDLLKVVAENTGATRAVLILVDGDSLRARMETTVVPESVTMRDCGNADAAAPENRLPIQVLRVARTTREAVVVVDAREGDFRDDPYLRSGTAKSLLCYPVLSSNELVALIYLENKLATATFGAERLQALGVLATQSAITLRNLRYATNLEAGSRKISRLKTQLEEILHVTKLMAASPSVEAACRHALDVLSGSIQALNVDATNVYLKPFGSDVVHHYRVTRSRFERVDSWRSLPESVVDVWKNEGVRYAAAQGQVVVPIVWRNDHVGVFVFEQVDIAAMDHDHKEFLLVVGQSLALALKNIDHQNHLEDVVKIRTDALNQALDSVREKQRKIQAIMDHINQGILTFDKDLKVEAEYSHAVLDLLKVAGDEVPDASVLSLVLGRMDVDSSKRRHFEEVVKAIMGEDKLMWTANSPGLPREAVLKGSARIVDLDWTPLPAADGVVEKMMLTIRDITDRRRLEDRIARGEAEQRSKQEVLLRLMKHHRFQLNAFFGDTAARLSSVAGAANTLPEREAVFRDVHTIKGGARTLGFSEVAEQAHQAEDALSAGDGGAFQARMRDLTGEIDRYAKVFEEFYGRGDEREASQTLLDVVRPVLELAQRVALAEGLEWGGFGVDDCIRSWDGNLLQTLTSILPHCINNALDHGYKIPREKGIAVRPVRITVRATTVGDALQIAIEDEGRGLDHAKLKMLARKRGYTDDRYLEVIFDDSVSTAERVTVTSGRGVGMAAVRATAAKLGGTAQMGDGPAGGALCTLIFPSDLNAIQLEAS